MALELVSKLPYDHPYRWDGTLFGGPKLWRPDELGASLALWLDAEDTASITLNGSTVSQWDDKSGNARHVSQATAANQPTYQPTGFNGRPTLFFDGGDTLNMPPLNFGSSCSLTILQFTTDTNYIIISRLNTNPYSYVASNGVAIVADGVWGTPSGRWIDGASAFPIGTRGDTYTRLNNANRIVIYDGINLSGWTQSDFGLGANFASLAFTGAIPEVIFTSTALSTADRERIEGYLAWKWGLEANLPVGHPYKNTPPTV